MILAIKTNQDPAEIYLLAADGSVVAEKKWDAGRTLAKNLLGEVEQLVIASETKQSSNNRLGCHGNKLPLGDKKSVFSSLSGVIVFRGPGSFTGLRIGITTANAIAYGQEIPIVGANGDDWLANGLKKLADGQNDKIIMPEYGAPPHITKPKK